jgi:formate hydrogenlyase regulatory protein HycA
VTVPALIPIVHEPDYRTDTIGRYDGGQFFASLTYAFSDAYRSADDWQDHKLLFAVLHRFDHDGHHTGSEIWRAGTMSDELRLAGSPESPGARAEKRLATMLDGLPGRRYCDIAIRPFEVVADGVSFGLVLETHDEDRREGDHDWAELYPDGLGFGEPWDGFYST